MALFNPLLESKVAQFDQKHGEPVFDDDRAWLIYEDGSSRKVTPSQFDFVEASDQSPAETLKWRRFWAKKMIPLLAQRFNRQQELAYQATGDDAARQLAALQKLHDQLVSIKQSLDDLNNVNAPRPQIDYTTWYDCRPAGKLEEGLTPITSMERGIRNLERSCRQIRRELDSVTCSPLHEEGSSKVSIWETRLAARLQTLEECREALRLQREWEQKPLEERQAIARQKLAESSQQARVEKQARREHLDAIRALSIAFVDDESGVQSREQKRLAEEAQREAEMRHETAEWAASRMSEKEERLQRASNKGAEEAARDEFAEAVAEGEVIQARRGRPPEANEAKPAKRRGRPPKKAKR